MDIGTRKTRICPDCGKPLPKRARHCDDCRKDRRRKPIGRMLESGGKIEKLLKAIAVHYGALSMKKVMSPPDRTGTSGYMVDREKEKHKTKHSNRESKHTTQQTKQSFQTGA